MEKYADNEAVKMLAGEAKTIAHLISTIADLISTSADLISTSADLISISADLIFTKRAIVSGISKRGKEPGRKADFSSA